MKLVVCILLYLVGTAVSLELAFNPNTYTVVEGGAYTVCVELVSGTATEDTAYEVVATYEFGGASRSAFIEFLTGDAAGEIECAELVSVSNNAIDLGNTIFLEIVPVENAVLIGEPAATVDVTDDDIVEIGFSQSVFEVPESESVAHVCVEILSASEETRRAINFRLECADDAFILQFPIRSEEGSTSCAYKNLGDIDGNETISLSLVVEDLNVRINSDLSTATILVTPVVQECVLQFVDNTPQVTGNEVRIAIPEACNDGETTCELEQRLNGERVTFENCVEPILAPGRRNRQRIFITRPGNDPEEIIREFRQDNTRCDVHLINGGEEGFVRNGDGTVTFEWEGTGPDAESAESRTFVCRLDDPDPDTPDFFPCASPYTTGVLSPGEHSFVIRHASLEGCIQRISQRQISFMVMG